MMTFDLLNKRAEIAPEKVALVDDAMGREFTYAQFNKRASRCAEVMRDKYGIHPGDRVAILAQNSTDFFEILYACAKIKAILVPINWRLAIPEAEFIVDDCTPKGLFYDVQFANVAEALHQKIGTDMYISLSGKVYRDAAVYEQELTSASGKSITMPMRDGNEAWYMIYTSGTTGLPKGVPQTFHMSMYNYLNIGVGLGLTSEDTCLTILPCFHSAGINLYANPTLLVGGTVIVERTFEPSRTLRLLSEKTTFFFGVPAVYLSLSQQPEFEHTDLSHVRSWCVGGASVPMNLLKTYARRGINIREAMGMTETGPDVLLMDKENVLKKFGSAGKPQVFVEVRIVDHEGHNVVDGDTGELLIRGPGIMQGYWKLPKKTAETIEPNGWLHSGDVARRDEDGYYYMVDRLKDMYISGGENIYPAEIENVLYSHPAISEVAVIGVSDKKWGEVGKAIVVVKPDHNLIEKDVIAFLQGKIARYKIPKFVVFIDKLPRNGAGKVQKTSLLKQFGEENSR